MREIGGYFGIEFSNVRFEDIHQKAIKLNTARNCLEYILQANDYRKIYVPYYTCDVVLEPIIKLQISYEFYHIDEKFEPLHIPEINENEAFLYTNYFGIKENFIKKIAKTTANLIVDNSQALFADPLDDIDTFYSLRKFVGTPDGAFLYSKKSINFDIEGAVSANRASHLYKRKDVSAAFGYNSFKDDDESLIGLPIMTMSRSTEAFLKTYDFEKNKISRERNFLYLHHQLHRYNGFNIDVTHINGPLCYPFLSEDAAAKDNLKRDKIYIPTYWTNVLEWLKTEDCAEHKLVDCLLPLPVDQRISPNDLQFIIGKILK